MKIHIVASGSKGNCYYVESEQTKILVDCGLSASKIEKELKKIGALVGEIDAIFLTHEHVDHTAGVKTMVHKYNIPVYATLGTIDNLKLEGNFNVLNATDEWMYKDILVNVFPVLHDAADPVGYGIDDGHDKIGIATDFGKITPEVRAGLCGSTIYILESNHDVDMVKAGPYPESLKQRILGDYGHISNEQCAEALCQLLQGGEMVYLAHLSEHNNNPTLARMTVESILKRKGITNIQLNIAGVREDAKTSDDF